MNKKLNRLILACSVLLAALALLCFPQASAQGAKKGLGYCLEILIPSLFPFMVLSVFFVKTGLAAILGKLTGPACRILFALPGSAAAAILMSMIGGYPVGARAAAALVEQGEITQEQAERMLCFCINAGPAFLVSVVGTALLGSPKSGILLLCAQLLGSVCLGVLSSLGQSRAKQTKRNRGRSLPVTQALIASTADASRSLLAMCAFVVLFAAILSLLRLFVPDGAGSILLSGILEVTGGCYDTASIGAPLWVFGFLTGWGGLCVHFQVLASTTSLRPRLSRFFLYRMLHAVLSAGFTYALCLVFPQAVPAFFSIAGKLQPGFASTAPASASLILLGILLLIQLKLPGETSQAPKNAGI